MPLEARRRRRATLIGTAPVARTATTVATAAVVAHGGRIRRERLCQLCDGHRAVPRSETRITSPSSVVPSVSVGATVASVSRGTSISTGPISVSTVFARRPPKGVPSISPLELVLLITEVCSSISTSSAVSRTFAVSWLSSPFGPTRSAPSVLAWANRY